MNNTSLIHIQARRLSKVLVGLFFIAGFIGIKMFGLQAYLQLEFIHMHLHNLDIYITQHFLYALCIYLGVFIAASILSLPGSAVFLTTAGILFDPYIGAFAAIIGATTGATGLFLLSRYVIGDTLQGRFTTRLERINTQIDLHGSNYLLVMRILSLLPFCIINILSGLTLVSVRTFIWTTALGVAPSALIYSLIGRQLRLTNTVDMLLNPTIFMLFSFLLLLKVALVPFIYKHLKK